MEISSRNVVEGTARSPHRAMYKAMGLNDDVKKIDSIHEKLNKL